MTTDLERTFFDTFGIEPYREPSREYNSDGEICSWYIDYPQITDRQYLELICLYVSTNELFKCFADTEKISFRNQILEKYIANKRFFDKHQVQAIFEGE